MTMTMGAADTAAVAKKKNQGTTPEGVDAELVGLPASSTSTTPGLRTALSSTYQGAELDRIIATFRRSRPGATPAQLYFAITTSPIWRDAINIAEAKAAQHAAPVFMYQLAYPDPTLGRVAKGVIATAVARRW